MGIAASMSSLAGSVIRHEVTTETFPDGRVVDHRRLNPYISTAVGVSAVVVVAMTIDQGDGMLTKIFSRRCIECGR